MKKSLPQLQLQPNDGDCRRTRIIGKMRDFILAQAPAIDPSVIERRIQELFPSFETPTHPPYALMIQRAVKVLNESNGSTVEAITGFIQNEFKGLPWAHSSILNLHLGKLCKARELYRTARGRYMNMDDYNNGLHEMKETQWRGGRKSKKYKRGRNQRCRETLETSEGSERYKEQGNSETRQKENTHERIQQDATTEFKDKFSSREVMNTEPHVVEQQRSLVIKLRIPRKKQPDNLSCGETVGRSEGAERCDELQELDNEAQFCPSELHEEQGKSERGQPGVTEDCHGRMVQGQGEAEAQQNENTDKCEKQFEATIRISRFCSDEISNNENISASLGNLNVAENQCENLPDNLLAIVEYQPPTQLFEATTEISRFYSSEIRNYENLSYSLGSPTVSVIPKEKLQIPEQEEKLQNETPSVQQKFSGACELLLDQEGPEFHMETSCSSLTILPYLPVDLTFDSQDFPTVPISTEFLEHTPLEGIELTPTKLMVQTSKCGTVEAYLSQAYQSLVSMTFEGHQQPHDDILGRPKGRVEKKKTFGDLEKHKPIPKYYKIRKKLQLRLPQGQGRGRRRWRSLKLDRNPHQHKEKLQFKDQTQTSVSFPSLDPNETSYSVPAPNLPANPNLQQLVDPTSEGSPRGISEVELFLRMSWERLVCGDSGTTSKVEDSLSSMNCLEHKQQQQHENKRGPKRKLNLDGKTESGHLEQQSPKRRCRGRSRNSVPTHDSQWSWVVVEHRELQSSASIERHCESRPQDQAQVQVRKLNLDGKTETGHHEQQSLKRRRGRPPKPVPTQDNQWSWVAVEHRELQSSASIEHHCESRTQDQAQVQVHSPNLADDNNPSSKQTQRRRPKLKLSTEACLSQGKRLLRPRLSKSR